MSDDLILNASQTISRRTLLLRTATAMAGGLLAVPAIGIAQQCLPTSADVLGPFYRAGAPARSKLTDVGDKGKSSWCLEPSTVQIAERPCRGRCLTCGKQTTQVTTISRNPRTSLIARSSG